MAYLIFVLIALALFIGFLLLSGYEARRGVRVFARTRARLDKNVERIEFILAHVNFDSFMREEMHHIARRVAHTVAHVSLQAVRATERVLTHLVRYLRTEHAIDVVPRENAGKFVQTLSDFKDHLKATRPKVPDIY